MHGYCDLLNFKWYFGYVGIVFCENIDHRQTTIAKFCLVHAYGWKYRGWFVLYACVGIMFNF
jgi:hypothetical protein